jgi:phage terminase large subunit
MRITRIERKQETENYNYTLITFKNWLGEKFIRHCVTEKKSISTKYVASGASIDSFLWEVVKAFLETGDNIHNY